MYNALLSPEENRGTLPDERGDALMPRIVPLNVDQSFESHLEGYADLTPSARLSLSIPLVHQDVAQSGGLMVGKNSSVLPAAFPSGADSEAQRLDMTFYAGLIELAPQVLDAAGKPDCPADAPCPYLAEVVPYAFGAGADQSFWGCRRTGYPRAVWGGRRRA